MDINNQNLLLLNQIKDQCLFIENKIQHLENVVSTIMEQQQHIPPPTFYRERRSETAMSDLEEEIDEDVHCLFKFFRRIACFVL